MPDSRSRARGSFAADLLALLERASLVLGSPRVAAIAVPPPDAVGRDGEFCALLLETGDAGLAFVLLGDARSGLVSREYDTADAPLAIELARRLLATGAHQRALGLAAANALSQALMRVAGFVPPGAADSFGGLQPVRGDRLGMVGLFPPLIRHAQEIGVAVTVLEMRSELVRDEPGLRVTTERTALAACNKVLCTSSVLLNDTLDAVLGACAPDAAIAIVGPSAGCLPDPLFARGVSFVGGTLVVRPRLLVQRVGAGAPWGDAARKYAIGAGAWPGAAGWIDRIDSPDR